MRRLAGQPNSAAWVDGRKSGAAQRKTQVFTKNGIQVLNDFRIKLKRYGQHAVATQRMRSGQFDNSGRRSLIKNLVADHKRIARAKCGVDRAPGVHSGYQHRVRQIATVFCNPHGIGPRRLYRQGRFGRLVVPQIARSWQPGVQHQIYRRIAHHGVAQGQVVGKWRAYRYVRGSHGRQAVGNIGHRQRHRIAPLAGRQPHRFRQRAGRAVGKLPEVHNV